LCDQEMSVPAPQNHFYDFVLTHIIMINTTKDCSKCPIPVVKSEGCVLIAFPVVVPYHVKMAASKMCSSLVVSHITPLKNWWCINKAQKVYLCNQDVKVI